MEVRMDKIMVSDGWTQISILKRVIDINLIFRHYYISKNDPLVYKENMEIVGIHVPLD